MSLPETSYGWRKITDRMRFFPIVALALIFRMI
jgi:hypothetical protein